MESSPPPVSPQFDFAVLSLAEVFAQLREVGKDMAENMRRYDQIAPGIMKPSDFQQQISQCRLRKHELDAREKALRAQAQELSRPHLRRLTLLDMPDEILLNICEDTQRWESSREFIERLYVEAHTRPDVVKNLRLTCRRLCMVSSPLLIPRLNVEMTPASLARMEKIVGHPLFRSGVRTISVFLTYYDAHLAQSIRSFAIYQARFLIEAMGEFVPSMSMSPRRRRGRGAMSEPSDEWQLEQNIFQVADDVLDALSKWSAPIASLDERQRTYCTIMRQAYAEYGRRWAAQDRLLKKGSFVTAIAAAAAQLGAGIHLEIHDTNPRREKQRGCFETLTGRLESDQSLFRSMLLPHRWDWAPENATPAGKLLLELPIAIEKAGARINSLKIDVWPYFRFHTLCMNRSQQDAVRRSVLYAKSIVIDRFHRGGEQMPAAELLREGQDHLLEYVQTILDAPKVESIELNLGWLTTRRALSVDRDPDSDSDSDAVPVLDLSPVLTFRIWPRIQFIHLHSVALPFERLRMFIDNIAQTECRAVVFASCILLSGSWKETLDYVRESTIDHPCRVTIRKPEGCESNFYKKAEMTLIFGVTMPQVRNLAGKYMDGTLGRNPFDILVKEGEEGLMEVDGLSIGSQNGYTSWPRWD